MEDGECCPVCTHTEFMKDFQYQPTVEEMQSWRGTGVFVLLLVLFVGFFAFIIRYLRNGTGYQNNSGSVMDPGHLPIPSEDDLKLTRKAENPILCLYVKEENDKLFKEDINALQEFLENNGLSVIDVYKEEHQINISLYNWVQSMRNKNVKTLVVDSDLLRSMLSSEVVLREPVEQAVIYYIQSCLHLAYSSSQSQVYVVRIRNLSSERFLDLGNERCYIFPTNSRRLLDDLSLDSS